MAFLLVSPALAAEPDLGFVSCAKAIHGETTVMTLPIEGGRIKFSGRSAELEMKNDQQCTKDLQNSDWTCRICKNERMKQSRGWVSSYSFRTTKALDLHPVGPTKMAMLQVGGSGLPEVRYVLTAGNEGLTFDLACSFNGSGTTSTDLEKKDARGLCLALQEFGINMQLRPRLEDLNAAPTNDRDSSRGKAWKNVPAAH